MMKADLSWNGEACIKAVIDAGWDGLRRAVVFYWTAIQNALNKPNTGVDVPFPDDGKWGSRRVYPNPSKPGEAPHKITGFGAGNVVYDLDETTLSGRVGVTANAKYMVAHELGVGKPVTIQARLAKALTWYDFGGSRWMFRRKVTKPPQPKRAFMLPTLQKVWTQLQAIAGSGAQSVSTVS